MASTGIDDTASGLLALIKKSSVLPETKLSQLNVLKSHIKHQRIPESAQSSTIECIRLAISSQTSSSLVTAGLATLAHLIKRLAIQDQLGVLFSQRAGMMPVLLDRLGDAKESYRHAAFQAFCEAWSARPAEVEKVIREGAIQGNNGRAREEGMRWVSRMHAEHDMQFRAFVAPIVELLEDADGLIRQASKTTLVELFRSATDRAKADLKRQLVSFSIRKSIVSDILSQLRIPLEQGTIDAGYSLSSNRAAPQTHDAGQKEMAIPELPAPPSSVANTNLEPLYVQSSKELEQIFSDVMPCFEGKETEHNWVARDKNILKLRRYTLGNAPLDYQVVFVAGMKSLQDGVLKVANSLRTTMSTNGCELVKELAQTLGSALEPLVELFMQAFIKMTSATKHISAQNGNTVVDAVLANASYHLRLSQHVWFACQDKNVQPRCFAAGWLRTLIERQAHNKTHFEHIGGLDATEKSIKKGLSDANPKVRESMRKTFWVFAKTWPEKGDEIASNLDLKSRQLLEKDNPNGSASSLMFTNSVGPGSSANPRAAVTKSSSTSLKETIAAQKRALASRKIPERPNSAMANLSPVKPERSHAVMGSSSLAISSGSRPKSHPNAKYSVAASSTSQGSLMSAPMRRPRRLDNTQRPATADPYAHQRLLRNDTPNGSPKASPGRLISKSSVIGATAGHSKSKSTTGDDQSFNTGPTYSSRVESPQSTPMKMRPRTIHGIEQAFSAPNSTISSVPHPAPIPVTTDLSSTTITGNSEWPTPSQSSLSSTLEEDNLTLVMPSRVNPSIAFVDAQDQLQSFATKPVMHGGDVNTLSVDNTRNDVQISFGRPNNKSASSLRKAVLAEVAPSDRNIIAVPADVIENELGSPLSSPIRKDRAHTTNSAAVDRTDSMKARRLLGSGLERIRARQLDAHGFRRLQELVKSNVQHLGLPFDELLIALLDYINAPNDALRLPDSRAQSLKSQALSVVRAVLTLQREDEDVIKHYPRALCAIITASRYTNILNCHLLVDLERSADELLRHIGEQGLPCLEAILSLSRDEPVNSASLTENRAIVMCFSVLTKLLVALRDRASSIGKAHAKGLGDLAVRFLDDANSDIRRADTEFCLELHKAFDSGSTGEFWKLLEGAREAQLNLVAYYLARQQHHQTSIQPQ